MPNLSVTRYDATQPRGALLVLAHGAGAGQRHPFMTAVARGLADRGVDVVTFDFPYMEAKRKVPDKAPVLEEAWREALRSPGLRGPAYKSVPTFIGGQSMGGRIATHIAAQGVDGVSGVVLLGYPLHPPGQPAKRRDAHLPRIQLPVLFVQGSSDTFGTDKEIAEVVKTMPNARLHVIEGGDHSFKVKGGAAKNAATFDEVIATVADWINGTTSR